MEAWPPSQLLRRNPDVVGRLGDVSGTMDRDGDGLLPQRLLRGRRPAQHRTFLLHQRSPHGEAPVAEQAGLRGISKKNEDVFVENCYTPHFQHIKNPLQEIYAGGGA